MPLIAQPEALLVYDYASFAQAKEFIFRMWCEFANERALACPDDLSGACKYGSQFMLHIFGGAIEGHYAHQFNRIDGRRVDLGHDALDVALMRDPYLHDAEYFDIPEKQAEMLACMPRVLRWADGFMLERRGTG